MEYYNSNTNEIKSIGLSIQTPEGATLYTSHISDFSQYGYYPVIYTNEKPDIRFYDYTETKEINGLNYEITYIPIPKDLLAVKETMKTEVKEIAQERILEFAPMWKQNNTQSRYGILLERKFEGIITEAEEDEILQLKIFWDKILNKKAESDDIEALIDDLVDVAACESFDADIMAKYRNNTLEW